MSIGGRENLMLDTNIPWFVLLLIGLSALLLLLTAALFISLQRNRKVQKQERLDSEETVLSYVEQALQAMEMRQSNHAAQDQMAVQGLLQEGQRSDAARAEALGERLERALMAQDARMQHLSDAVGQRLANNDEKVERLRDTLYKGLQSIQNENALKLDEMRRTVDENLHQTLNKRLGESFSLVNERLEQVYKGLGEMRSLASGVGDLKRVLTNVKTRGVWGEMQLGALIEQMLAPSQYMVNAAVKPGSQERVEYAICLPGQEDGKTVLLPVDAKFPIEAYSRLTEAVENGDAVAAENARNELTSSVLREAGRIAGKYIQPPYTTDFAIMYLPLEGLYAQVLQLPDMMDRLQKEKRIVVSGPSTFYAMLSSLQMGFRTLAIEKRSGEVWQLLGSVKAEFGSFADILDKTQQKLRQASESIETATRKTRTIERRLRSVEENTGNLTETVPSLSGIDAEE